MDTGRTPARMRHARMPICSAVLISLGGNAWSSEIEDLSATGLLVRRPGDWHAEAGALCVLDMLIGDDLHINVEASVARVTPTHVGFAYTRIPEGKEAALWSLLGGYADRLERFSTDT